MAGSLIWNEPRRGEFFRACFVQWLAGVGWFKVPDPTVFYVLAPHEAQVDLASALTTRYRPLHRAAFNGNSPRIRLQRAELLASPSIGTQQGIQNVKT